MTDSTWGTAEAVPTNVDGVPRVVLRIGGLNPIAAHDAEAPDGAAAEGAVTLTVEDARRLRDDLDRAIAAFAEGGDRP